MAEAHIHTVDDERGYRDVFLDGEKVSHCVYADTQAGVVECYADSLRIDPVSGQIVKMRRTGVVTVVPKGRK